MSSRRIEFFDGSSSSTTPTMGNISASDLVKYANDAAYEAAEAGSPIGGNIYYNTTDDTIRYYDDAQAAWIVVMTNPSVDTTFKIIDDIDNTKSFQFEASSIGTGINRIYTMPNEDTTLVGTGATQTLTNKTIDGANNVISNLEHGSEVDNPSSGVHGVTGSVVGTTDIQTLSNKTISDDLDVQGTTTSTTPTSGALTVAGGAGVAENLNVGGNAVITGDLTVSGTTTTIDTATMDVTDANITVNNGGTQATANSGHAGITVEMSDATDADIGYDSTLTSKFHCGEIGSEEEIITAGHAQQITNKDIDLGTATNTVGINVSEATRATLEALTRDSGRVYYSTDDEKFLYDTGVELKEAGSGAGSGGINHIVIEDSNFETASIKNWATYADAASDKPVDGTGGAPNVTQALNTTTPLRDAKDLKLTKDAADRQGEGWAVPFSTDLADQSTMQEISFEYSVTANFDYGTAGDPASDPSDVVFYIYDVTNAVLIQPSTFSLDGSGQAKGFFQAASNSTSYRLILHVATVNALAWDMFIDNVRVGPVQTSVAPVIGDWSESELMDIDATTTDPTKGTTSVDEMRYRRDGQDAIVRMAYHHTAAGTAGSGDYLFRMPIGLKIDTTKLTAYATVEGIGAFLADNVVGSAILNAGTTSASGDVVVFDEDYVRTTAVWQTGEGYIGSGVFPLSGTERNYVLEFRVPIQGWGANGQVGIDDGRPVVFTGDKTSTQAVTASVTDIIFVSEKDSHGAWSSDTFTVPISGDYSVSATIADNGANNVRPDIYVNGSLVKIGTFEAAQPTLSYAIVPDLQAGDTITVRNALTSTLAAAGHISISRLSGASTVQPSDIVAARANATDSQLIPNNIWTVVTFENKDHDTHGSFDTSTGVFTAPAAGYYHISSILRFKHNSTALNGLRIRKNTSVLLEDIKVSNGALGTLQWMPQGSTDVYLEAGDTIDIQALQTTGVSKALLDGAIANNISIHRIK